MRIIAGTARRVRLEVAEDSTTRPLLEMARGALFNALGERVTGARILDLYAGSGALGLEALSRGAATCLFVERDPAAFAALRRNIEKCRMTGRAVATRSSAEEKGSDPGAEFDLIFIDPPFPELAEWRSGGRSAPVMLGTSRFLAAGGCLVFRMEDGKAAPPAWPGLALAADRRYGRSRICRYERRVAADSPCIGPGKKQRAAGAS